MTRRVARRSMLFAAVVATAALIGTASSARATPAHSSFTHINFNIYVGNTTLILPWAAAKFHFFQKNGISVTFIPTANAPVAISALESGSTDFLLSSADVMFPFLDKGVEAKLLGGIDRPYLALVARKGSVPSTKYPASIKALAGKKVGVSSIGSGAWAFVLDLLGGANMSSSSVNFVSVGGVITGLAALESGNVDAVVLGEPALSAALRTGNYEIVADARQGANVPTVLKQTTSYDALWTSNSFLSKHPDIVTKVRRALAQTQLYMQNPRNFARVRALYADVAGDSVPAANLTDFVKANLPQVSFVYTRQTLNTWINLDYQLGLTKNKLSAGAIYAPGTPGSMVALKKLATGK